MTTFEERQRGSVYKSLETDHEFADRVRLKHYWYSGDRYYTGRELDEEVWDAFRMQRRIIERDATPSDASPRATR